MRPKISFAFFVEYHIMADHNLLIAQIVQLVTFQICVIADEDETLTFIIKLVSSLVRYMNMGYASKDS